MQAMKILIYVESIGLILNGRIPGCSPAMLCELSKLVGAKRQAGSVSNPIVYFQNLALTPYDGWSTPSVDRFFGVL